MRNLKIFLAKLRSFLGRLREIAFNIHEISFIKKMSSGKNTLIFLPTIEFFYPLFQRPQYLATELSKFSNLFVLYLEASNVYSRYKKFKKINNNLIICRYFRTAPYFLTNSWLYLISGQAINTIYDLKKYKKMGHRIIYDYVDEISIEICGDEKAYRFLKERHEFIKKTQIADLVLCTTKTFIKEFSRYYPSDRLLYLPNGVDLSIFDFSQNYSLPSDLADIYKQKKIILGYHGAIAKWLDFNLINEVAKKHPEINFVFLGYDYDGSIRKLNLNLKNVFYLGVKKYTELPSYLAYFDFSWIPFKYGKIAEKTSPLKLYESLAMKKLVLASAGLKECYDYEGVFIFKNNPNSFEKALNLAIKSKGDKKLLKRILNNLPNYSWEAKAKIIYDKISGVKDGK